MDRFWVVTVIVRLPNILEGEEMEESLKEDKGINRTKGVGPFIV